MRIINKKALHNYQILESLEAGIALTGAEVKSIRAGGLELSAAYVKILNSEAYLVNANIAKYEHIDARNYDTTRSRKLLLHKDQINLLMGKTAQKGITIVPVSLYDKNHRLKLEIGLAKSKKEFDKRKDIKERDQLRRIEQEFRGKE